MAWPAYVALLGIWLAFVAPALGRPHAGRGWARGAAGLGLAAALYEGWMTFVWGPTVVGPIRIDIFLLFGLLTVVYLLASTMVLRAGWRLSGLAAGGLTLAAAVTMAAAMAQTGREMALHQARHQEGTRLLFEAKFAHQAAYDAYFRLGGGAAAGGAVPRAGVPAGHWSSDEALPFTRLVVGSDGRVHLFFGCAGTECQFGSGTPLEPHADGSGWTARLEWRGVGERNLELDPPRDETLELRVDGQPHTLRRTPPPLLGLPVDERLVYLGAFSAAEPIRKHVRVSQLWLWRGEDALFAVGVFRILLPGPNDFVTPVVMGRGTPEGDGWRFAWEGEHGVTEAVVRLASDDAARGVELELTRPAPLDPWPAQHLAPGAIFRDDAVELAARGSPEAWAHWTATLLEAHFSSGVVPGG